jgi:glycine cleavage system H protein
VSDYEFPAENWYTREDEWVRVDEDRVVIGVTDYAQQQLGDVVFLELPEAGDELKQGEPFGVIESVKAVSDLFAPITGEVLEANEVLQESPELVNESCYDTGWILAIAPSEESEFEGLMNAKAYRAYVEEREGGEAADSTDD